MGLTSPDVRCGQFTPYPMSCVTYGVAPGRAAPAGSGCREPGAAYECRAGDPIRCGHALRLAWALVRGLASDLRHAARPHPGAGQAGGQAGPARAAASARGAAADRARVGDGPAAGARWQRGPGRRPRSAPPRGGRGAQRRPGAAHPAHPRPGGRRGDPRGAGGGARRRRRGDDRPHAAGGAVGHPARHRRRARALRPRRGRRLLRRGDPGRAGARGVPRVVPGAEDPGQRVVGLLRPGGEPVLRRAGRPALERLHHAQLDGRAGGRRRLVAGRRALRARPRSTRTRTRRRRASGTRPSHPRPRAGTARRGCSCWTGTTSSRPRTHMRRRWSSPARRSATRAPCARGTRRWPPAPRGSRRRWPERGVSPCRRGGPGWRRCRS